MLGHFVIGHIDNILVYSPDPEIHVSHVKAVRGGLLKSTSMQKWRNFSHMLSARMGLPWTQIRLLWWQHGNIQQQLRCYWDLLVLLISLATLSGGFSSLAAPLTSLIKNAHKKRNSATKDAPTLFKGASTWVSLLKHPSKPFMVEVNAFDVGTGAILSQHFRQAKVTSCGEKLQCGGTLARGSCTCIHDIYRSQKLGIPQASKKD